MKRILFVLLFAMLVSCKKDEIVQTQAQITANKLSRELGVSEGAVVSSFSISVFSADNSTVILNGANIFTITSDGFIEVTSGSASSPTYTTFNLEQLKSYQIFHFGSVTDLDLYF